MRAPETVAGAAHFVLKPARIHIPAAIVPAVVVGFAAQRMGFEVATLAFAAVVAVLAVIGLVWIRLSGSMEPHHE